MNSILLCVSWISSSLSLVFLHPFTWMSRFNSHHILSVENMFSLNLVSKHYSELPNFVKNSCESTYFWRCVFFLFVWRWRQQGVPKRWCLIAATSPLESPQPWKPQNSLIFSIISVNSLLCSPAPSQFLSLTEPSERSFYNCNRKWRWLSVTQCTIDKHFLWTVDSSVIQSLYDWRKSLRWLNLIGYS